MEIESTRDARWTIPWLAQTQPDVEPGLWSSCAVPTPIGSLGEGSFEPNHCPLYPDFVPFDEEYDCYQPSIPLAAFILWRAQKRLEGYIRQRNGPLLPFPIPMELIRAEMTICLPMPHPGRFPEGIRFELEVLPMAVSTRRTAKRLERQCSIWNAGGSVLFAQVARGYRPKHPSWEETRGQTIVASTRYDHFAGKSLTVGIRQVFHASLDAIDCVNHFSRYLE